MVAYVNKQKTRKSLKLIFDKYEEQVENIYYILNIEAENIGWKGCQSGFERLNFSNHVSFYVYSSYRTNSCIFN